MLFFPHETAWEIHESNPLSPSPHPVSVRSVLILISHVKTRKNTNNIKILVAKIERKRSVEECNKLDKGKQNRYMRKKLNVYASNGGMATDNR